MNRHERRMRKKQGGNGSLPDRADAALRRSYELAEEYYRTGKLAEAEKGYRKILETAPNHVLSLHQLGAIAMQKGDFAAAAALFDKLIAQDGNIPQAHCNLGVALHKQHQFDAALQSFLRAIELRPADGEAHSGAGLTLQAMDRHAEAVTHFRKALASGYQPHYQKNLAISLRALGRFDEAVKGLEVVLARDPGSAEAHRNLGNFLLSLGRIEAARTHLRKAIERNPRQPMSYYLLAEAGGMAPDDPAFIHMQQLAAEMESLTPEEQIDLHFALGKTLADIGEKAQSFEHYLAGNALKRSRTSYDEPETLRLLDRIRAAVTRAFLDRHRQVDTPPSGPIFIVGMPRSGTTLVEQVLASHPRIFAAGERNDFSVALRELLQPGETHYSFLERLDQYDSAQIRAVGAAYGVAIGRLAPEGQHIVDKMPANFRFIGLIHAAIPGARIIHVRRDPVDTCLSCFSQLFSGQQFFAYELGELGRYWKAYDRLMAHWRDILPDGVMLELNYEDLVRNFEPEARRLIAHCGLEWDQACVAFHKTERPVMTASWAQVRQPLYRSSVGRWQPQAALLKPLRDALENLE